MMMKRASPNQCLEERFLELDSFYESFQKAAEPFVAQAVCRSGCADCCTNVGEICATTLETLRIKSTIESMPLFEAAVLRQRIAENRARKKQSLLLPCPFLDPSKLCTIYPVRPFSCRRLYSLKPCGDMGPVVHREFWSLAEHFTRILQTLDPLGYSGHVTYVLGLFEEASFVEAYLSHRPCPQPLRGVIRDYELLAHTSTWS